MMRFFKLFWILFFIIGAAIPLWHMNTAEVTEQENRTLAKFPEVRKKGKINSNYGKEFEAWLGDRFWGRDQLIDARFQALYKINGRIENEKAFIGDDGWMFEKWRVVKFPSLKSINQDIEKASNTLKEFSNQFKDKNILIYLLFIPDRSEIYKDKWSRFYHPVKNIDFVNELGKKFKGYANMNILYPKEEFVEKSKGEDLFWKDDIHLSVLGRNLITSFVLDAFKKDFLGTDSVNVSYQYSIKDAQGIKAPYIARLLNIPNYQQEPVEHFDLYLNDYRELIIDSKQFNSSEHITAASLIAAHTEAFLSDKNLYIMGICYAEIIFRKLAPLFQKSTYIRLNMSSSYSDEYISYIRNLIKNIENNSIIVVVLPDYLDSSYNLLSLDR